MNFEHLRHDFLSLFDEEDVIDIDAKIFRYKVLINNTLLFRFYISWIEGFAAISLQCKNIEKLVFDIGICSVDTIRCHDNTLFFYKKGNLENPFAVVQIKPFISLSCNL